MKSPSLLFRAASWAALLCFAGSAAGPLPAFAEDEAETAAAAVSVPAPPAIDDTITMSFDGASLKDVLLLFSQKTGMNFVASSDVEQRKITVYFENVSPKEALDAIMTTNDLTYTRKPGSSIYMVYARRGNEAEELVTKVFKLKYARLSSSPLDIGGQQTVRDMRTMASASTSSSSSGGSDSGSSSSGSSARGIDLTLRSFLSSQGRMATDISTNSIIVTDTQDNIERIQKMLVDLDVPQAQVILEVHVMETQKGLISDQGIQWGGANGTLLSYTPGSRTSPFPYKENFTQAVEITAGEDGGPVTLLQNQDPLTQQMSFGLLDASNFRSVLHFITTDSDTKILARPRVLTQNNEAAIIRLVANTAISESQSLTSGQGALSNSTTEAERAETGVTLRLTPQINPDNSVMLFVEPSVTTVNPSTILDDTFDPTTRVVRTMARVQDNQTLVIGGLIESNELGTKRKIPYLGDLPGVGRLFSYNSNSNGDRELLILITPHIVHGLNSLTQSGVTARGKDVLATKMIDSFSDKEADIHMSAFEPEQQRVDAIGNAKARRERNAANEASRRASDPSVDRQMGMALDAFSPQLLDDEISKALSFQTSQQSRSANG